VEFVPVRSGLTGKSKGYVVAVNKHVFLETLSLLLLVEFVLVKIVLTGNSKGYVLAVNKHVFQETLP